VLIFIKLKASFISIIDKNMALAGPAISLISRLEWLAPEVGRNSAFRRFFLPISEKNLISDFRVQTFEPVPISNTSDCFDQPPAGTIVRRMPVRLRVTSLVTRPDFLSSETTVYCERTDKA